MTDKFYGTIHLKKHTPRSKYVPDTVMDARDVQTGLEPLTPALWSHGLHLDTGSLYQAKGMSLGIPSWTHLPEQVLITRADTSF